MDKNFWIRALQRFNPDKYQDLCEDRLRRNIREFFQHFGLIFIIMSLLFIPAFFIQAPKLEARLDQFTNFEINGTFESNNSITLLEKPKIIFDKKSEENKGQILFSNEGVYYKQFYWFGNNFVPYNQINDIRTLNNKLTYLGALFIWPALIFWAGSFILIKAFILLGIFTFLGWLLPAAFKKKITFKKSLQVAFIALTPALFFEMLIYPFYQNAWIGFIIYLIFYGLGITLISERKIKK